MRISTRRFIELVFSTCYGEFEKGKTIQLIRTIKGFTNYSFLSFDEPGHILSYFYFDNRHQTAIQISDPFISEYTGKLIANYIILYGDFRNIISDLT
jgi:hypothetical protein